MINFKQTLKMEKKFKNGTSACLIGHVCQIYIYAPRSITMSGASCSKLTTSLVNVSLKFQTLIIQIHCYFLLKKCENPLHCKGFSHFFNKK